MPDRRGMVRENRRPERVAADFFQRAGHAAGIARELNRRRVGEKLTLSRDGGLNQSPEKITDITEHQQPESHGTDSDDDAAGFATESDAAARERPENAATGESDDKN